MCKTTVIQEESKARHCECVADNADPAGYGTIEELCDARVGRMKDDLLLVL